MPLSGTTVNIGEGGLGRAALTKDGVCGLVLYNNTPPSGFSSDNIKKIRSLESAEDLGIIEGGSFDVDWYHISEFFRANSTGELWVGYFPVPAGAYDFTEVEDMDNVSEGEIRMMGVYAPLETFAIAQSTTFQSALENIPQSRRPLGFLATDMSGITAISGWDSIGDLRTLTNERVVFVSGQDGAAAGKALFDSKSYSITVIGRIMGDHSRAAVNQSVAEVNSFDISNGTELETPALANGDLVSDIPVNTLGAVKDKGYAVIRKRLPEIAGTYHERTPAAVAISSDFAFVENTRVIDKAKRGLNSAYTPYLNSRLFFNDNGTLTEDTVGFFQDLGQDWLDTNMEANQEISASEVTIDPAQDVRSTSTLTIAAKILPTDIAEFIVINIGFTVEI